MDMPIARSAAPIGAPPGERRVVLFDFDGVLFRGDAFARLLRGRYARVGWLAAWLLLASPLLLLMAASARGRGQASRWIVAWGLWGLDERRYQELATGFGRTLARDARNFQRDALAALNRHRHAGDRVLVVTGCEHILARAILDELGLPMIELVASRVAPGRFGLRVVVRNIGREKPRQLAGLGITAPWALTYSDSAADLPMLAAAQAAVLVNARSKLARRVERALGREVQRVDWY
jgi:phosphatidylglycerophosphatase C